MPTKNDPRPRRAATLGDPRLPERFWAKVSVNDNGCWTWTASVRENGYAQFGVTGQGMKYGHRVSYAALVGPIADGYELDHTCHSRASGCRDGSACMHRRCVNPDHLDQVTHLENMRRRGLSVTHCIRGHEYTAKNTYRQGNSRSCIECRNAAKRAFYYRQRARLAADLAEMVAAA